jgi:hypothetical protein
MKNLFAVLWASFWSFSIVFGQYEPMAIEGAHWVVFDKDNDSTYHHALIIEGDSIVNGKNYKKIFRREIQSGVIYPQDFLPPYYYTGDKKPVGLIRDDTIAEIVYGILFQDSFFGCNVEEETLIHDYSLQVGSPLVGCLHEAQGTPSAVVDSLKIEFVWGKQREVQYVSPDLGFIEGIGGGAGPFSSSLPAIPGIFASVVHYCIGDDDECGLVPVGTSEPDIWGVRIFPNPVDDHFQIELAGRCNGNIFVSLNDAVGRVVWRGVFDCISLSTTPVPVQGLAEGIYFLNIRSSNHATVQKILVH